MVWEAKKKVDDRRKGIDSESVVFGESVFSASRQQKRPATSKLEDVRLTGVLFSPRRSLFSFERSPSLGRLLDPRKEDATSFLAQNVSRAPDIQRSVRGIQVRGGHPSDLLEGLKTWSVRSKERKENVRARTDHSARPRQAHLSTHAGLG